MITLSPAYVYNDHVYCPLCARDLKQVREYDTLTTNRRYCWECGTELEKFHQQLTLDLRFSDVNKARPEVDFEDRDYGDEGNG